MIGNSYLFRKIGWSFIILEFSLLILQIILIFAFRITKYNGMISSAIWILCIIAMTFILIGHKIRKKEIKTGFDDQLQLLREDLFEDFSDLVEYKHTNLEELK